MFNRYDISIGGDTYVAATDMTGVERRIDKVVDSVDGIKDALTDEFVEINNYYLRTSLIRTITKIANGSFTIITDKDEIVVKSDDIHALNDKYNEIAEIIKVPLQGFICKDCGKSFDRLDERIVQKFNDDVPKQVKMIFNCHSCRRPYMKKPEKLQSYDTFMIKLLWEDEVIEEIDPTFERRNL